MLNSDQNFTIGRMALARKRCICLMLCLWLKPLLGGGIAQRNFSIANLFLMNSGWDFSTAVNEVHQVNTRRLLSSVLCSCVYGIHTYFARFWEILINLRIFFLLFAADIDVVCVLSTVCSRCENREEEMMAARKLNVMNNNYKWKKIENLTCARNR